MFGRFGVLGRKFVTVSELLSSSVFARNFFVDKKVSPSWKSGLKLRRVKTLRTTIHGNPLRIFEDILLGYDSPVPFSKPLDRVVKQKPI